MKALPTIALGMLIAFLALLPLVSIAAAATVSVSVSPTNPIGAVALSITGTVSPAPGAGVNAFIQVFNSAGKTVASSVAAVDPTAGTFSYAFTTGGTSLWTTGTYSISANAAGTTGSTTFTYTCTETVCGSPTTTPAAAISSINVQVTAESPIWPGQSTWVSVLTSSATNGSLVEATFQTIHYHTPAGGLVTLCTNTVTTNCTGTYARIHIGFYTWTFTLPSSSIDGGYFIHAWVNNGNNQQGQGLGAFTVNSALAQQTSVAAISTALTAVQGSITSIQGSITSTFGQLSTTLTTLQTAATATQDAANKAAAAATALSGSVTTITTGVQSSQTYILVVAALAAITLVLELAILVRKLS